MKESKRKPLNPLSTHKFIGETSKQVNNKSGKQANNIGISKVKRTYYMKPETLKKIKQRALDENKFDYEVLQDALEAWLGDA